MRHVATTLFILVGIINFLPVIGVLGAARLESLYGVTFASPDLLLLMRHRAVLFGIVGGFIIASAFRIQWRALATVAGLVSMMAYVVLALPLQTHGAAIQRVFWADVIAIALLICAYLISRKPDRIE